MNRKILFAAAALAVSAVMFFFGTGMRPLWWLMWLGPIPVLLLANRVPRWPAFGIAALSWMIGTLNMWRYLRHVLVLPHHPQAGPLVMPIGVAIGVLVVPSCVFGLAVLRWRAWVRQGALWRAALALPVVWITYEYLTSVFSPHGTFGSIAYSQMDCLPVLQVASLAGISGVIFCLFLGSSTIATLLVSPTEKGRFAASAGVFFFLVITFGWWRLHSSPGSGQTVKVGLVASDARENLIIEEPEENGRLLRDYLSQAKSLAAQGAEVIVIPEKLSVLIDPQIGQIDSLFKEAANAEKTSFVIGVLHVTNGTKLNEARMYSPNDPAVVTYEKHHMLPAFESKLRPGTKRALVPRRTGQWGMAICKDMDFPLLSRHYGNDGIGLLLVPAWDFADDDWLHDRMAVMRGVESGFSIARAAKQGLLTVSNDRGQVLAERSSHASTPFASLVADIPVRNTPTLYARFGDWFAWLNLALLLLILPGLLPKKWFTSGAYS